MSKNTVTISIDEKKLKVPEGEKILWAALENDIYIPNLCAIKDLKKPAASCRLCYVEVEGKDEPVTACSEKVTDGMIIKTRSDKVDRLVKTAFELLIADHDLNCGKCPKNKNCELQKISKERGLKLKQKRFRDSEKEAEIDDSPKTFAMNPNRCVLCGRCIYADREIAKVGAIGFTERSLQRCISTFKNLPISESKCIECGECVKACPVGALYFKE
ncbi:2Fe-2S iron-sulfur cluster-binding protein [Natranaerofaba carboxydovora]|uniref:2Fe-2S iron-sulfur cluster-binding protein n=1 Tax=Natranaerofaba carboxydovora TaxID=2742683 RepID=UPI001F135746|nr:2Fe-2S iron-sulfur cluster-binding protein [Natranaerofaba carboxydovora]UMZ74144.1 NADPH-Fe(3+) oxidoreductase subunit alpha [Natranaerofaba carboxydovora]